MPAAVQCNTHQFVVAGVAWARGPVGQGRRGREVGAGPGEAAQGGDQAPAPRPRQLHQLQPHTVSRVHSLQQPVML